MRQNTTKRYSEWHSVKGKKGVFEGWANGPFQDDRSAVWPVGPGLSDRLSGSLSLTILFRLGACNNPRQALNLPFVLRHCWARHFRLYRTVGWAKAHGVPDTRTIEAYAERAEEFAATYNTVRPPFLSRILEVARPGGRLLDIGCGSGRDLAAFAEEGMEVFGLDPVETMREVAGKTYPVLKGRLRAGSLPDDLPEGETYDVVHCAAVLMHLFPEELFNAVFSLRNLLVPEGICHLSFSPDRPGLDDAFRSPEGRLFRPLQREQVVVLLERAGFRILSVETGGDRLGREAIQWVSILARRDEGHGERPLQRIEEIVTRDTKDATYKLALLRSLTELAGQHFHDVRWLDDGRVAVPSARIVDQWIRYYWPLFAVDRFIPQKNGEYPGSGKPISFRQELTRLVSSFSQSGGYLAYREARWMNPSLDRHLRSKIQTAIRTGPVVFTSGQMFQWMGRGADSHLVLPGGFWKELAELGHWIEPAIRLRWAEETRRFSKQQLPVGEVLSLLSTDYEVDRNVALSRHIFAGVPRLRCTWTERTLNRTFDVDHILPYSLWHTNDLWNLVPTDPKVNRQKRDRLVDRAFFLHRRDAVIHAWELQREQAGERFDCELHTLLGRRPDPDNWQHAAFQCLAEAIEATALRRKAERWSA